MFDFLFPNHPFGGHTLRLVAQAQQGGGDVFDIARAMKNVEAGDKAAWERAWLELAEKTEARAKQALAAGRQRTARQYFFHASNYYRMSDVLLTIAEEPSAAERFRKSRDNFRAAAKLNESTIEVDYRPLRQRRVRRLFLSSGESQTRQMAGGAFSRRRGCLRRGDLFRRQTDARARLGDAARRHAGTRLVDLS